MRKIDITDQILYNGATIISGNGQDAILNLPASGGGIYLPQVLNCPERYYVFNAEVLEDHCMTMGFTVRYKDEPSNAKPRGIRFGIYPKWPATICIDLEWLDGHILFPGHTPGQFKVIYLGGRIDMKKVSDVILEGWTCFHDQRIRISNPILTDERPSVFSIPEEKMIDQFGQYKRKDWPGKIKNLEELREKLNSLLNQPESTGIKGWNEYGGWTEKKLCEGTGFFSRIKKDGRWWLVDPNGYAFFSTGTSGISLRPNDRIDGIEKVLDWIPSRDDPEYKDMFLFGSPFNRQVEVRNDMEMFSFKQANLYRALGKDWHEKWVRIMTGQLRDLGLNTRSMWADELYANKNPMPFVDMLRHFPSTKESIFRDFPDVLSGEYEAEAMKCARYLEQFKNDRLLVGYFLRNEPAWAFVDNLVIAEELLNNPKPFVSKDRLIEFLKDKYKTPEVLSKFWNRTFTSFDDLRKPIAGATEFSKAANDDLHEFSRILYAAYISVPSKACRKVDPNHMNLGMRWAWVSGPDVVSGWENFDVFTINHYFPDPTDAINNIVSLGVDLPVLITEFHFGALDTGLISTGLWGVANQEERGKAYRYYCERTAAHPHGVGCYWFMLYDQFPLGGFDGENYNIGLFDVCSLPNRELTKAVRETSEVIYLVADGKKQATTEMAKSIPAVK